MFEYIAPISFSLPSNVIEKLNTYIYIGPGPHMQITRQIDRLIHHTDPKDLHFPKRLTCNDENIDLTEDLFQELKEMKLRILKEYGLTTSSRYKKTEIIGNLKTEILSYIPQTLHQFNPTPVIQTIEGQGMLPHTDFIRSCSMFYLLTDPTGWSTMWYQPVNNVDLHQRAGRHGFLWPFVNFEDIELKKTIQIEENRWYAFDNHTYHAVKYTGDHAVRRALQIEFADLTAEQLYKILK